MDPIYLLLIAAAAFMAAGLFAFTRFFNALFRDEMADLARRRARNDRREAVLRRRGA